MSVFEIRAARIGESAQALLSGNNQAKVLGVTSRGCFLQLSEEWVVYLSVEPFRGPLTINLTAGAVDPSIRQRMPLFRLKDTFAGVSPAQTVMIYPDRIEFRGSDLIIYLDAAAPWFSPLQFGEVLPQAGRIEYLTQLAQLVITQRQSGFFGRALEYLLEGKNLVKDREPPDAPSDRILDQLIGVQQSLKALLRSQNLVADLIDKLAPFLGLGSGLTPSGDDLVIGLLLTLNRWGDTVAPQLDCALLNQELILLVRRKTTLLSANLIECAGQGQADERLLLAVDGIMTGTPDPVTSAAHLLQWGKSSGIDALTGMAIVLRSL